MGIVSLLVELSYLSVVCICTKSESEHVTGMRNLLAQHSLRLRYCAPYLMSNLSGTCAINQLIEVYTWYMMLHWWLSLLLIHI